MDDTTPDICDENIIHARDENTCIRYVKIGNTTVQLVEHFSGTQTYSDVIRDALRREFSK